ncbi:MAG TPA: endo-1,3-alpha-glucanase family glycosylhydrolase [Planctomycetota bacterium]|jgi:hypothetical protein
MMILTKRAWVPLLFVASFASGAQDKAIELALPLFAAAEAADKQLASASDPTKGYFVDLTRGSEGVAFRSQAGWKLQPGRYRLHVLVSAGPGGNSIVDPVEVTLSIGKTQARFPPNQIPKPGPPADLRLDFVATADEPLTAALNWYVGDSLLKTPTAEITRPQFLERRKGEILKAGAAAEKPGAKAAGDDDIALNEDEKAQIGALSKTPPKYRLAIAAAFVEALSPVNVESVQTDKETFQPGEKAKLTVQLRNDSNAEADVTLAAEWLPADAKPGAAGNERQTATVKVPAGGSLSHAFPEAFTARGDSGTVGRIAVTLSRQGLRPATNTKLVVVPPVKRLPQAREKKIFAHYMGCWPAGTGPIYFQRQNEGKDLKHDAPAGSAPYFGGHVRNFDLVDPARQLSAEESADLEIRRAMRIGIDGFAIDAWAGQATAKQTLDVLFKVAETKNYSFELTLCIDPMCGGNIVDSVKELLDKHGKSPKLARRDGKPLVFGYQSVWSSYGNLMKYAGDFCGSQNNFERSLAEVRTSPLGWHIMGQALHDAARQVGQPIYHHYCMSSFFLNVNPQKDSLPQAAGVISQYADAVGGFAWLGPQQPDIAKAVRAGGAEWSMPVGMYQKENVPYECYVPKGTDWMHWGKAAIEQDATLLQIITWNDYGENTCIAPAYNTRYTMYDLTGYEIKLWKTGKEPVPDHDRVYLIYRKYPPGAKIFPFHAKFAGVEGGAIEVLTILPKPAKIRLPGRDVDYDAPAGFFRKQFPVTAGAMTAELVRDGKVELALTSPEPITDKPFREDNGFVCWSSEEERFWKEDFNAVPPFWYSEYGDADNDGLPNWFEMYWFSKERGFTPKTNDTDLLEGDKAIRYSRWLDFSTAVFADPKANPSGDGKTNLQHYLEQSDPTKPSKPAGPDDPLLRK